MDSLEVTVLLFWVAVAGAIVGFITDLGRFADPRVAEAVGNMKKNAAAYTACLIGCLPCSICIIAFSGIPNRLIVEFAAGVSSNRSARSMTPTGGLPTPPRPLM